MLKNQILNLEKINTEYSFYFSESKNQDRYFCSCGNQFISKNEEEDGVDLNYSKSEEYADELYGNIYQDIKLALDVKVECSSCKKNFSNLDVRRKLITIGDYFISGYEFQETDTDLIFYYAKACPGISSRINSEEISEYKIVFDESIKYIRFEKESKKLMYQDFGNCPEVEFDLNEVIKYVNDFFIIETDRVIDLYKLHLYISRLANFVSDTNSGTIVSEFLESIRNTTNDVGMPYIKKLLSIFYGIIKYSNLSTIALTKSSQFLYDLMLECDIPSSIEMINSKATSPISIFNFLVNKYNASLNEEVNEDNKDVHDFTFRSTQRVECEKNEEVDSLEYKIHEEESKTNFTVKNNKNYKSGKVVNIDGKYRVIEAVSDGTISKFIYNNISKFSEYKQIIKYFKFYNKQEVISLIQKNDINLLIHTIDYIYFRSKMEFNELSRVLNIIETYIEGSFFVKDYKNIKQFSFVEYDDARMMMEIMGFNPHKHFNKIKTYDKLTEYHDLLVKYYKVKSEEEKSGNIKEFVSKFNFLETKGVGDYTGPLEIVLHNSPDMIINEGIDMSHSAGAYAPNVSQGTYLLGSLFDRDVEKPESEMTRFTIGFTYDKKYGLEFDQVKGFANKQGSNRFKNLVMKYLTSKDISFKPIKDLKLSSQHEDGDKL